jgi:putative hemolysin
MLIFSILFFLILSALFSGAEIAFVSASKLKIELKKKKWAARGAIISKFYEKPSAFLGAMLVGNNITLVVFTSLMTVLLSPLLRYFAGSYFLTLLINTVIITIVILIFGEFLPKTLFRLYADDVLFLLAYPLRVLKGLLAIPTWVMTRLSDLTLSLIIRAPLENVDQALTRLDLENFIRESQGAEGAEEIDKELFGKALNLKDTRVSDCMVPRTEMETIDVNASTSELETLFAKTKLSRIVVIKDDIDNVLGYVHHQQLLAEPGSIKDLIMDIPFVPEVMRVTDLMNTFIKEQASIACVVDEFGGVSGLITLEDILEEIFGEIEDEYDEEEHLEEQISETEYRFSGRLEISYLNEKYPHLQFSEGEYHTLSGYLVTTTQTIPEQGGIIVLDNYKFILEKVSETKVEIVRVVKLPED